MNTQKRLALILLVLSIFCQSTQAQPPAEDARIARLIGLAKVWGAAKYFHPYLAYRDIDWDKALIDTIPKVNAAKTPQDYQAALNQMLAALNDKTTRADLDTETKTTPATAPVTTKLVRTENGVLVIEVVHIAQAVAKDLSTLGGFVTNINQSLPSATGVIIDARGSSKATELEAYHLDNFLTCVTPMGGSCSELESSQPSASSVRFEESLKGATRFSTRQSSSYKRVRRSS